MSSIAQIRVRTRELYLGGPLGAVHTAAVVRFVQLMLGEGDERGSIVINSEGGEEIEGFAMYDLLRPVGNRLTALAVGQVQSAALLPYLACDKRSTTAHAAFMFHHGTWRCSHTEPQQEVPQIVGELMRLDAMYVDVIAERSGTPRKRIAKLMSTSHYFDAAEAEKLGIVTGRKS